MNNMNNTNKINLSMQKMFSDTNTDWISFEQCNDFNNFWAFKCFLKFSRSSTNLFFICAKLVEFFEMQCERPELGEPMFFIWSFIYP